VIWISATLVGFLFGLATWLLLQRGWLRILFGVVMLGHAANLAILSMSGDPRGKLPPITDAAGALVDPLPQALLLTAIVIGFAVVAYFVTLLFRLIQDHGKRDLDALFDDDPGRGA
jgi:multicomponent Na+:H+ antiporter subunit C